MTITTYTLPQIKAALATSYAAAATVPANTDQGSTLGAFMDADSLIVLNIQSQVLYSLNLGRLATSFGADVDSFVNPWGVFRIGASPSGGLVTLQTPSNVLSDLSIPVGGVLATESGLLFTIIADASNTFYNAGLNAYIIATGTNSANVTVQCQLAGSVGNVLIGAISQPYNGLGLPVIPPAINSISNAAAYDNGINQETDAQLKIRFTLLVSTGAVATQNAIMGVASSVQAGLTVSFGDRKNADGSTHTAYFTLVVNELGQNTGPGSTLLSAVLSAVDLVRSAGISFQVIGPTLVPVNGAATIVLESPLPAGSTSGSVLAAVLTAYNDYVNNIGLDPSGGSTELDLFSVGCVLLDVPGVKKIDGLTLNSGTADIVAAFANQIVAGSSSNFHT